MVRWSCVCLLLVAACAPDSKEVIVAKGVPIFAHLVVHVDPLPRLMGSEPCADERLVNCGALDGRAWRRRTRNLEWLTETWIGSGRTMDLQLGPEAALGWMEDPDVMASLAETLGASDAEEVAQSGRTAVAALLSNDAATLGMHLHNVLPDPSGVWGEYRLPNGGDPCGISADVPGTEVQDQSMEELIYWSSMAVAPLAQTAETSITSLTSHTPRTMGAKITAALEPDALDPSISREFPSAFAPRSLGAAYSECFQQAVDHPPLEVYAADTVMALRAGDGLPIVPGNRVVGSMAPHLGAAVDGSTEAAKRRLVQLLLNWRVAALNGDQDRPWVFTFHEHLFDLGAGGPNPNSPEARQRNASNGQSFRPDLESLAEAVDELVGRDSWAGIGVGKGGVLEWARPDEVSSAGSGFNYVTGDGQPLSTFEPEHYPYLPLVAERLKNSHYRCNWSVNGTDALLFDRCPAGWAWGETASGYHCTDSSPPEEVLVLVRPMSGCVAMNLAEVRAASITAEKMGEPEHCGAGIWVPQEGLIVEARGERVLENDVCATGVSGWLGG